MPPLLTTTTKASLRSSPNTVILSPSVTLWPRRSAWPVSSRKSSLPCVEWSILPLISSRSSTTLSRQPTPSTSPLLMPTRRSPSTSSSTPASRPARTSSRPSRLTTKPSSTRPSLRLIVSTFPTANPLSLLLNKSSLVSPRRSNTLPFSGHLFRCLLRETPTWTLPLLISTSSSPSALRSPPTERSSSTKAPGRSSRPLIPTPSTLDVSPSRDLVSWSLPLSCSTCAVPSAKTTGTRSNRSSSAANAVMLRPSTRPSRSRLPTISSTSAPRKPTSKLPSTSLPKPLTPTPSPWLLTRDTRSEWRWRRTRC
mmetsp:Transcript_39815/g.66476  ORF Transcript_39815/g.66476 Transcript_39815/m.66476 type:complete len:310 (-) Transcript_39815:290-1219(-)